MKEKTNKATLTTSEGTGGHNNKPLNQFEITTVTLTAVEWLQEQYNQCPKYEERIYEQDWDKAKEMHKQEIMDAWHNGFEENRPYIDHSEDYYNETFKSEL